MVGTNLTHRALVIRFILSPINLQFSLVITPLSPVIESKKDCMSSLKSFILFACFMIKSASVSCFAFTTSTFVLTWDSFDDIEDMKPVREVRYEVIAFSTDEKSVEGLLEHEVNFPVYRESS